jgi:hypothetical protein
MKQEATRNSVLKTAISAFIASASIAGIVGHANTSQAFFARQDASYCTISAGDPTGYVNGCNNTTAGSLVVSCPVEDTSSNPKASIVSLNLHVVDNAPSFMIAQRCVNFFAAAGTSCGGIDTSVNGVDTLFPPNFAGWSVSDFGFLSVTIPPRPAGGSNSCIKGYFSAN